MNWGNKIIVAFVLFAAFIGYLVYGAFQEDFDLVTEDYYAQELNYQEKIEKLRNAKATGELIEVNQAGKTIQINYPNGIASGTIHFYHPSTKAFDRNYEIKPTEGFQEIPRDELIAGHYRVNFEWENDQKKFLQESKLFIQ